MLRKTAITFAGVIVTAMLSGCADSGTDTNAVDQTVGQTDDHAGHAHEAAPDGAHPTEGPHGGLLIELGDEEYHAELLHDDTTHTTSVHILDAEGKLHTPIDHPEVALQVFNDGQFVEYVLKPTGETLPTAEFSLVDEQLCNLLHGDTIRGRLNVTIKDKAYVGTIHREAEGHEGHDHAEHKGHDHEGDTPAAHEDAAAGAHDHEQN